MKRFACVAAVCLVATLGPLAPSAQAQGAAEPKLYVELNGGPTLGHKSDKFFGGEAGLMLTDGLDVFIEASHIGNAGTSDLDTNAQTFATFLGGTVSAGYKVNHGAIGLRYRVPASPRVHPYVLAGVGLAQVTPEVVYTVGGSVIDPAARGVQLGGDLSGSRNKTIVIFGVGVNVPFKTRFFADLGYRYGRILANVEDVENDTAIPTQRIILGAGIRF